MTVEWLGWLATAAFASSYLAQRAATLRRVQAVAALLWIAYGLLIHAMPVVAANAIIAAVALGSSLYRRPKPIAEG